MTDNPYQSPETIVEAAPQVMSPAKTWRMGAIFGMLAPLAAWAGYLGIFVLGRFQDSNVDLTEVFMSSLTFLPAVIVAGMITTILGALAGVVYDGLRIALSR